MKMVSSSASSQAFESTGSNIFYKGNEGSRAFEQSVVRQDSRPLFNDLSLAKSGFFNPSSLGDSTVRGGTGGGIGRGLGNLPEDRIRKIAKDFVSLYGMNGELSSNSLYRIQR